MLINTPVIYLQCGKAVPAPDQRVRAYLEANAQERHLGEAIARCLRKSPETIRYSVKPVALKGGIHPGTLLELLHFLAAVKKSGRLLSRSGADQGEVDLFRGDVARASLAGLSGAEAVEAILSLVSGSFEFHEKGGKPAAGPGKAALDYLNTQRILMDWAKKQDESNHDSRA
jgi:hypothetical protein